MPKIDFNKPKKYPCFTDEQQKAYEKLPLKQRQYVDFRAQGNNKAISYTLSGDCHSKRPQQCAQMLERRNPLIVELVDILLLNRETKTIETGEPSLVNTKIDALASQKAEEDMMELIESADAETARRIKFYRDIVNGKIKSVKETRKFNAQGVLIEKKIEKYNNVETMMSARKELDRLLGLHAIRSVDEISMGDITINIVDASKREEVEDSRNQVKLSMEDVQIIDGETVIVEKEKKPSKQVGFENAMEN